MQDLKQKTKTLFQNTEAKEIIIPSTNSSSFYYFTQLPFNSAEGSILILRKNRVPLIISTSLFPVKTHSCFKIKTINSRQQFFKELSKSISGNPVGLNYVETTASFHSTLTKNLKIKTINASPLIESIREQKNRDEIKRIKKACSIASAVMESVPEMVFRGVTEKELKALIEAELLFLDAEPAFSTVTAFSSNTKTPHHIPGNRRLKKGLVLIDFGARYKNYCSDISRMFYAGSISKKEKQYFNTVIEAKNAAEEKLVEGTQANEIAKKTEKILSKQGFKLQHALGHGIGLKAHDYPSSLSLKSDYLLKKNMVLAIEPAVYWRSGGIRIEDNYVVKRKKAVKLSHCSEKLSRIA